MTLELHPDARELVVPTRDLARDAEPFPCIYCDGHGATGPIVGTEPTRCTACDGLGVELAAHAIVRELESLVRFWMHPEYSGDVVDDVHRVIEQCGGSGLLAAREQLALDVWNGGRR